MAGYFSRPGDDDSLRRALMALLLGAQRAPQWTSSEIGGAGERIVVDWLRAQGYSGNWDTRAPGSTDIEAWGPAHPHLLIQVKTGLYPNDADNMSPTEEQNIRARAARVNAQPYEAKVQVDAQLRLMGEVNWRRL